MNFQPLLEANSMFLASRSTPIRGWWVEGVPIREPIRRSRIVKRIVCASFSLISCLPLAGPAFQPPPPNRLWEGGWRVRAGSRSRTKNKANGPLGSELRMMRLTDRDQAMLDWLTVVRIADLEAVRWALAALG